MGVGSTVEQVLAVRHALDQAQELGGHGVRALPDDVLARGGGLVAHHDALLTPGSSPRCAISRRQTRQRPNFRSTARARPQRLQRV
jgi:hypothetical protein